MTDPGRDDRPARPLREVIAANPAARDRVWRVYAELLTAVLAAVAGLSILLLWHLARRGRIVRHRLGPPRPPRWPEPGADPGPEGDRDRIEE